MNCSNCGAPIMPDANFCPYCRAKNNNIVEDVVIKNNSVVDEPSLQPRKPWCIFAKLGYTFGLICFITMIASIVCAVNPITFLLMYIPYIIAMAITPIAIVFSALGKKCELSKSKAKSGLIYGIIAACLFPVAIILFAFVVATLENF